MKAIRPIFGIKIFNLQIIGLSKIIIAMILYHSNMVLIYEAQSWALVFKEKKNLAGNALVNFLDVFFLKGLSAFWTSLWIECCKTSVAKSMKAD